MPALTYNNIKLIGVSTKTFYVVTRCRSTYVPDPIVLRNSKIKNEIAYKQEKESASKDSKENKLELDDQDFKHAVLSTTVNNVCSSLYKQWNAEGRTKRPENGLNYDIVYADTMPEASRSTPVVLTLHGAAGSHLNFKDLCNFLTEKGIRVLAPNYPSFGFTKDTPVALRKFSNTPEERSDYILKFLKNLGVSKLDMIVTHSSAVYNASLLCQKMEVKSFAMVNPSPHQLIRVMPPAWLCKLLMLSYSSDSDLANKMAKKAVYSVSSKNKTGSWKIDMDTRFKCCQVVYNGDYVTSGQRLKSLASKKLPMLALFSKNDPIVHLDLSHTFAKDILSTCINDITCFDSNGNEIKKGTNYSRNNTMKVIEFATGTHDLLHKWPNIINDEVWQLFNFSQNLAKKI